MDHSASWSCLSAFCQLSLDSYSLSHSFQYCILYLYLPFTVFRVLQNRWKYTGFYSLKAESFILRETCCLYGNDYSVCLN